MCVDILDCLLYRVMLVRKSPQCDVPIPMWDEQMLMMRATISDLPAKVLTSLVGTMGCAVFVLLLLPSAAAPMFRRSHIMLSDLMQALVCVMSSPSAKVFRAIIYFALMYLLLAQWSSFRMHGAGNAEHAALSLNHCA